MTAETIVPTVPRYPVVRPEWLSLIKEAPLEPDLPIIDPHHHLWDLAGARYMFDELMADLNTGHNIVATVYAQAYAMYRSDGPQALRPIGEIEFVNGVSAMSASGIYGPARVCAGITGFVDLRLGSDVEDVLKAAVAAGNGRLKAIRHITAWDEDVSIRGIASQATPNMMADPAFRQGFSHLAQHDLTFEAFLYHPQLDELTDLAEAFPDTPIVLNHAGTPLGVGRFKHKRAEVLADWKRSIDRLAACPNVSVKLGGLAMRNCGFELDQRPLPPSSEYLAEIWSPFVDHCIGRFGPAKCMFESNFPVDKGFVSYPVLWNAFKRLAKDYSQEDKHRLFSRTANEIYRLGLDRYSL
ncbi:Predicted metal-dependent hydrolase, TIM-barrel fold [Bosea sp. OK403]|uniref:amidohydrolase family protein n=1 Tax=Bosea sp. OK403 TaxID=1855286 RepID=UPI0008ED7D1E|nr:amidohydrolase family protein [Bosea sp. OK403]SFJ73525.1 Predicted metal-dependent hydrolase, TIM-barrel fold [Bosea sp. OK403]